MSLKNWGTNIDGYRKARKKYNAKYYARTSNIYPPKRWTTSDDNEVLEHKISDTDLSVKLKRSVGAIQHRRNRLLHDA